MNNTEQLLSDLTEELDLYAQRSQEAQLRTAKAYCDNLELRQEIKRLNALVANLQEKLTQSNQKNRSLQQKLGMYQAKNKVYPATKLR